MTWRLHQRPDAARSLEPPGACGRRGRGAGVREPGRRGGRWPAKCTGVGSGAGPRGGGAGWRCLRHLPPAPAPGTCSHAPSRATCRVRATSQLLLTSRRVCCPSPRGPGEHAEARRGQATCRGHSEHVAERGTPEPTSPPTTAVPESESYAPRLSASPGTAYLAHDPHACERRPLLPCRVRRETEAPRGERSAAPRWTLKASGLTSTKGCPSLRPEAFGPRGLSAPRPALPSCYSIQFSLRPHVPCPASTETQSRP